MTEAGISQGDYMSRCSLAELGYAESLLGIGKVTSKYGSQCSKGLPTTIYFSTAPSGTMADKTAFTVQQHVMFLACCKISVYHDLHTLLTGIADSIVLVLCL